MTTPPTRVTADARNPSPENPAWRWGRATELCRLHLAPDAGDDAGVVAAWMYLRDMSVSQTQQQIEATCGRYPLVSSAHRVYRDAGQTRRSLEELLSQGKTLTAISKATTLSADLVRAYRTLFFDIDSPIVESPRSSSTFSGVCYAEPFRSKA